MQYTTTSLDNTIFLRLVKIRYECPIHGVVGVEHTQCTEAEMTLCPYCGSILQAVYVYGA